MESLKVQDEINDESFLEQFKTFDTKDSGFVSKVELKRFMYQLTGLPIDNKNP